MNWMQRFMAGRYGTDQLSFALLLLGMILTMVANRLRMPFLMILSYIPFVLCLYRIFSRNINRRQMENNRFFKLWFPWKKRITEGINRQKASKYFRFYKCPNCKIRVKVPKNRGKIKIKCPKCRQEFIRKT